MSTEELRPMQDPYPLSGLKWGASLAMSGDASTILVGAPGQVVSGALTYGADRAIDGKVGLSLPPVINRNPDAFLPFRSWEGSCPCWLLSSGGGLQHFSPWGKAVKRPRCGSCITSSWGR